MQKLFKRLLDLLNIHPDENQRWTLSTLFIDELPVAKLYKPGQVMFAKREAVEWKRDPTMPTYEGWRNQVLRGLKPSDWRFRELLKVATKIY